MPQSSLRIPAWVTSQQTDSENAIVRGPDSIVIKMDKWRVLAEPTDERGAGSDSVPASKLYDALAQSLPGTGPYASIQTLDLMEDTPYGDEWDVLARLLPSVRWLSVDTGFDEEWNDEKFPLQWPLESLVLSSACGTCASTPAILDGRVPHLVLFLTCGLRFEGPSNAELCEMDELEEPREDGSGGESKIKIKYIPGRASKWLQNKYQGDFEFPSHKGHESKPPSRMHTLEILENDAIDTFQRFAVSSPHVVDNLERLNIRSTTGLDFGITPDSLFPQMLPALEKLKHLELSIGGRTFDDPEILPNLYKSFPPNLESLKFRGPPSLAQNEAFSEWIKAFGRTDYLPKLKKLSFVLDVPDYSKNWKGDVLTGEVEAAKENVNSLLDAARARNVVVEEFQDFWMLYSGFH